jgi:hypothetical protein
LKLNKLLCTAALAVSALASVSAYAVPVVGTIPGDGQSDNTFVNTIFGSQNAANQLEGWYQFQLYVTEATTIDVEYFGSEADLANMFSAGGVSITHTGGDTITGNTVSYSGTTSFATAYGLIPFSFLTGNGNLINNGSNPGNTSPFTPNLFVTLTSGGAFPNYGLDTNANGSTNYSGTVAWLFLDDGLGGIDDNHDDMIIRLTVRNGALYVPEPASLGLLGLGLLGLGALRRGKRSA